MKRIKVMLFIAALAAATALLWAGQVWATSYTFTTINEPNGTNGTFAYGINGTGGIVGRYYDASGVEPPAFVLLGLGLAAMAVFGLKMRTA